MRTSKFKKSSLINRAIKNYREVFRAGGAANEWKLIDLTKEERKGKTFEQMEELRKQKYAMQIEGRKAMSQVASENNMTRLYEKAQKAREVKKVPVKG